MTRYAKIALLTALPATLLAQGAPVPVASLPVPRFVEGGRFEVLLLSHASAAALSDSVRIGAFVMDCGPRLSLGPAERASIRSARPWDWGNGTSAEPGNITILVARSTTTEVDCGGTDELRLTALARGIRTSWDTSFVYPPAFVEVVARRGKVAIDAVELERIETIRVTRSGGIPMPAGAIRLTIPLEALAPDSTGVVSDFAVEVLGGEMVAREVINIPWADIAAIWEQSIPARSGSPGANPPVEFEHWVAIGASSATRGDSSAARVAFAHALQMEPCLTLSGSTDQVARSALAPLSRPPARCRASVLRAAARGTLLPGFGQVAGLPRKIAAVAMFGVVAGSLIKSQSANDEARDLYDQYLAVDGPNPTAAAFESQRLYDKAESRRAAGTRLVVMGAVVWGASLVEATVTEINLQRRLARVQGVTPGARTAMIRPFVSPTSVGLAVSFSGGPAR